MTTLLARRNRQPVQANKKPRGDLTSMQET